MYEYMQNSSLLYCLLFLSILPCWLLHVNNVNMYCKVLSDPITIPIVGICLQPLPFMMDLQYLQPPFEVKAEPYVQETGNITMFNAFLFNFMTFCFSCLLYNSLVFLFKSVHGPYLQIIEEPKQVCTHGFLEYLLFKKLWYKPGPMI